MAKGIVRIIIIIIVFLLAVLAPGVGAIDRPGFGGILWQKTLGGSLSDMGRSVQQTSDGGYIVAGYSGSKDGDVTGNHGGFDYWTAKLNPDGSVVWQRSLGGLMADQAMDMRKTGDGGFILTGISDSKDGDVTVNHGYSDYWIVKLASDGTPDWQRSLGGLKADDAFSIWPTADGGYIVAGSSKSSDGNVTGNHGDFDYWIVKLASNGTPDWQRSLGGSAEETLRSIRQTSDGGYIVAGSSESSDGNVTGNHGDFDYWIVKLASDGTLSWQKCLGGSDQDFAYHIQQTGDGGYIVVGSSASSDGNVAGNHGVNDYWIIKLTADGSIVWQKCLGGSGYDYAYDIQQTSDGGYIVAGSTGSNDGDVTVNHGGFDYWIVKLASDGTLSWQKSLGGTDWEEPSGVEQTSDGGFVVTGYTISNDGDVTGNHGGNDFWVVRLAPESHAAFNAHPVSGSAPLTVSFDDGSSMKSISRWNWSFGDGTYSAARNPAHTYVIAGNYSVTLSVSNTANDTATVTLPDFIRVGLPAPVLPQGIPLYPGWNFVSTNRTLAPGSNTAAIFAGVNTSTHSIWQYNAFTGQWVQMSGTSPFRPLDALWIYSENATIVPLNYSTDPILAPPTKPIYRGWNAIGFSGTFPVPAHDALLTLNDGWVNVIGFDAAKQQYDVSIIHGNTGLFSDQREMAPLKGYWLYDTRNDTLAMSI